MYDYLAFTQGPYLEHHGVMGMRWGVRRYQNPDGSYTDLGRRHYGYTDRRVERAKKALGKRSKAAAEAYASGDQKAIRRTDKKATKALQRYLNARDRLGAEIVSNVIDAKDRSRRLRKKLTDLEAKNAKKGGKYSEKIERIKKKKETNDSEGWKRIAAGQSNITGTQQIINAANRAGYDVSQSPTWRLVSTPRSRKAAYATNAVSTAAIMAARAAGVPLIAPYLSPWRLQEGHKYKVKRRNQNG